MAFFVTTGAFVDARDNFVRTALFRATERNLRNRNKNIEIMRILLEAGEISRDIPETLYPYSGSFATTFVRSVVYQHSLSNNCRGSCLIGFLEKFWGAPHTSCINLRPEQWGLLSLSVWCCVMGADWFLVPQEPIQKLGTALVAHLFL